MRNAFSIFFIPLLFSLTIGIGVRFSDNAQGPVAKHDFSKNSVRKTSSITPNSNCFALLHILLESKKQPGRKLFKSPMKAFKAWKTKFIQGIKFNWSGIRNKGFKFDIDKIAQYRNTYEAALANYRDGFEKLTPNSLNIDRNPESVLGFIYAFNRTELKYHWLEQDDILDLGLLARRRLNIVIDKLLNQREISANEYDDLMQEMMWKIFGKRSKLLMDGILGQLSKEALDAGDTDAVKFFKSRAQKAVYEVYVREMSSMALEKTTLFMAIKRDKSWWSRALQSTPAQLLFSGLSWVSLLKGIPVLPWFVDTMPRIARHRLSYKTMQKLINKGPTKEFFEEAHKNMVKSYGSDFAYNSLFRTNNAYEKFRVGFQRYIAPMLPFIAIAYEYGSLTEEFKETGAEITALDALNERYQESVGMIGGLKSFGIVLVDAYIPEKPYEIPVEKLKSMEQLRESHANRSCRMLKSCLIAKMQQAEMNAQPHFQSKEEDVEDDVEMDLEQAMLNTESPAYKFCKRVRDPKNECTIEELSVIVHSMIE